jgi:hypothetical protein
MGPYSYETAMTQMAYLFNNRFPNVMVAFRPNDRGWEEAFRISTTILQKQPTTRVVMKAYDEGQDPMVALGQWVKAHPDTAARMAKTRGTDIETWMQQEVEYLTKYTHRRVKTSGKGMGYLDEAQTAEWDAYLAARETTAPPKWFNPTTDVVLREGSTGEYVQVRMELHAIRFSLRP